MHALRQLITCLACAGRNRHKLAFHHCILAALREIACRFGAALSLISTSYAASAEPDL